MAVTVAGEFGVQVDDDGVVVGDAELVRRVQRPTEGSPS